MNDGTRAPKICAHCGIEFVPRTSRSTCCSKNCQRLRWYYAHHEQAKANTRAWQAANAERWAETKRVWGQANAAQKAEALRRFYANNPLSVAIYSHRRREAKIRNTRGIGVTPRDIERLINRFGGRCAYCGDRPEQIHIDHVVPLARGGSNSIGNLLPACPSCNLSKNSRFLTEWRKQQRFRLAA